MAADASVFAFINSKCLNLYQFNKDEVIILCLFEFYIEYTIDLNTRKRKSCFGHLVKCAKSTRSWNSFFIPSLSWLFQNQFKSIYDLRVICLWGPKNIINSFFVLFVYWLQYCMSIMFHCTARKITINVVVDRTCALILSEVTLMRPLLSLGSDKGLLEVHLY